MTSKYETWQTRQQTLKYSKSFYNVMLCFLVMLQKGLLYLDGKSTQIAIKYKSIFLKIKADRSKNSIQ